MKVETKSKPQAALKSGAAPSFKATLQQVVKRPVPAVSTSALARPVRVAAGATTQGLVARRVHVDAEASRLLEVRGALVARAQQLVSAHLESSTPELLHLPSRALQAISRELVAEFGPGPARDGNRPHQPQVQQAMTALHPTPPRPAALPEVKAAQAMALIEQIETFVSSANRPAMALTLNNSLGARVEIERVGPRAIALKLVGVNGPPTPDTVSRVRDELRARGLTIATLEVA
jgi:hypothetical protein